jgi:hypothetical protein
MALPTAPFSSEQVLIQTITWPIFYKYIGVTDAYEGDEKTPTRKIVMGGSPTLGQKMTCLWESDLNTTNLGQLSPTFAESRYYEGAFSAGSPNPVGIEKGAGCDPDSPEQPGCKGLFQDLAADMPERELVAHLGGGPGLASLPIAIGNCLKRQNYPDEDPSQMAGNISARRLANFSY